MNSRAFASAATGAGMLSEGADFNSQSIIIFVLSWKNNVSWCSRECCLDRTHLLIDATSV